MDYLDLPLKKFLYQISRIRVVKNDYKLASSEMFKVDDFKAIFSESVEELLTKNEGTYFDVARLVLNYAKHNKLETKVYLFYYYKTGIQKQYFRLTCLIKGNKKMWYDTTKMDFLNSIKGFNNHGVLFRGIYKRFFQELSRVVDNFGQVNVGCKELSEVISVNSYVDFYEYYIKNHFSDTIKNETSSMAIVYCKSKLLMLKTNKNEWVFPKGHIEVGETSKQAAMRECFEESGVNLSSAEYLGEVDGYTYSFNGSFFRISDADFYNIFGASIVKKKIDVHTFKAVSYQEVVWQVDENFKNGAWIDVYKVKRLLDYKNTVKVFEDSLTLYQGGKNNGEK